MSRGPASGSQHVGPSKYMPEYFTNLSHGLSSMWRLPHVWLLWGAQSSIVAEGIVLFSSFLVRGCPESVCDACRYAWYKLYNLSKGYNKNLSAGDVQTLASNVLLSALAILPYRWGPLHQLFVLPASGVHAPGLRQCYQGPCSCTPGTDMHVEQGER